MGRFVMRKVPTGVKFDLKAANGEVIATSEVYGSDAACQKGVESVCKCARIALIEDETKHDKMPNPKFRLYRDKAGSFRFCLTARNGKVIAVSEPYATHGAALAGIESVKKNIEI